MITFPDMNISIPGESMQVVAEQQLLELQEKMFEMQTSWSEPAVVNKLNGEISHLRGQIERQNVSFLCIEFNF